MKVLFLLDSLGPGGAEKSTALLMPGLRALGVETRVVLLRHVAEGFEDEVKRQGFSLHVLSSSSALAQVRELRSVIRDWCPDVVHTAIYTADQFGRLATLGTNARLVSSWISVPRLRRFRTPSDPPLWKIWAVNAIDALTGRIAVDRYHAVTPGVAQLYASAYRVPSSRVTVVERGRPVDQLGHRSDERRALVRDCLGVAGPTQLVVTAGRQEHQKAHVDLIRAVWSLRQAGREVLLLIAGREGSATPAIHETLEALPNASDFVRLLGHRDDVPDLIAAGDVMALSSIVEGTAGSALEAMALGTPIVSTRLDGMAGILQHERNALIVDVGRPDQMASAIERLLDDPALGARLADVGRTDFLDRFTLERSAERMLEMYRSVLAEH